MGIADDLRTAGLDVVGEVSNVDSRTIETVDVSATGTDSSVGTADELNYGPVDRDRCDLFLDRQNRVWVLSGLGGPTLGVVASAKSVDDLTGWQSDAVAVIRALYGEVEKPEPKPKRQRAAATDNEGDDS